MFAEDVSRLYEQVQGIDVKAVRHILKTTFSDETITTALDQATVQLARNEHVDVRFQICSELLLAGAQITLDQHHHNLIQHCCKHGNSNVLKQALATLDRGDVRSHVIINDGQPFALSNSPWRTAVRTSHIECMEHLFHCFKKNNIRINLNPAIKYTVETGNLASLSCLIKPSHNRTHCTYDIDQQWAILAFRNKHCECAKLLFSCCTNISALMCGTDKKEEWEFILTNMTKTDSNKGIAHYVAFRKKWECLKYILQDRFIHGIDLNCNDHGDTLLIMLVHAHKIELMEQLLKYDVDINEPSGPSMTPLEVAISQYSLSQTPTHWNIIRTLISHGCNAEVFAIGRPEWEYPGVEIMEMLVLAGVHFGELPISYWNEGSERRRPVLKEKVEKAQTILRNNIRTVHPLKHHARLSVRRALTTSRFGTVPKLSGVLPPAVINYMMLSEIDDIEATYGVLKITKSGGY